LSIGVVIIDWIDDCSHNPIHPQSSIQSAILNPLRNRQSNPQSAIPIALVNLQSSVVN
jgi:hypothetical protein